MPIFKSYDRPSPFCQPKAKTRPLYALTTAQLERADTLPGTFAAFALSAGFEAREGEFLLCPGTDGTLEAALFGLGGNPKNSPFISGRLAGLLPKGDWHFANQIDDLTSALIGFAAGSYRFERYTKASSKIVRLIIPESCDAAMIKRTWASICLARDLINTPANDMQPDDLEHEFEKLADHYGATFNAIRGNDLLKAGFPLIHAVGRAAEKEPRLLEMRWGRKDARTVTLVGKGVCFDTGGLDIKSSAGMAVMKKDMGGAANVMALASMIMDAGLDIALRVIVPSVENSIASNAFRPGDIYRSRKGLTIQIDNTDAEGRLILADALTYADEESPNLLIDMATLTGAARVALGPDVPAFFTDNDDFAASLSTASAAVYDPLWRLPLFVGYEEKLKTGVADLTNAPSGGMAGAITAALFLKRFVSHAQTWVHFDIYGYSQTSRDFGPPGGEAQTIRALFETIKNGTVST